MREAQSWTAPFATDFSGMDMAAYALDNVLSGSLKATQCWASDMWDQARAFCLRNHSPEVIYGDTMHKPGPGPPIMLDVAGPPLPALGQRGQ